MKNSGRKRVQMAFASICALCGCSPALLSLRDNSAPAYSVRGVFRINEAKTAGIEADIEQQSGSGMQTLRSSERAHFGSTSVQGPVQLSHTGTVRRALVAYNHQLFTNKPVEMEWFAGVAAVRLGWQAVPHDAQPVLRQTIHWAGPAGGITGRWKMNDWVGLEGRWMAGVSAGNGDTIGELRRAELALSFRPTSGMALRVGLTDAAVRARKDLLDSIVQMRTRGPFVALSFEVR